MTDYNAEEKKPPAEQGHTYANISGAISVWLVFLFVALAIQYVVTYGKSLFGSTPSILVSVADFILFIPGYLIFPLVVGAAIGAEVGKKSRSVEVAMKAGLINGIYASLVYAVAITVIYAVLTSVLPAILTTYLGASSTLSFLLVNWLAYPVAIVLVVTEIFSVVSHFRKINL